MDTNERTALIQRYRDGYDAVERAISGVTDAELDARPTPDDWTAREVVHHLADSELRSTIRLRQLLAEDDPVIQGYDEGAYARRLHYDRPIAASLEAFRAARAANADLFAIIGDQDWARAGTHQESGRYSLDDWLLIYANHPYDHAEQILRARGT
jgi:DinB superfamily